MLGRFNRGSALWCGFLLLLVGFARPGVAHAAGVLTLLDENDSWDNTDRYYTNGTKLNYVTALGPDNALTQWVHEVLGPADTVRSSLSIGQSMFTPKNLRLATPQPNDRPYAGWLYAGWDLITERASSVTTAGIELGVVGPSAGAQWLQDNFHGFIGSSDPSGWKTQIKDQFSGNISLARQWRQAHPLHFGAIEVQFEPHLGAAAGNVSTQAFGGASIVVGNELAHQSLPLRIRPGFGGSGAYDETRGIGWLVFAGLNGRVVLHDEFLQGDTPYTSLVQRKHYVIDAQAGAALRVGRAQLTFTMIDRTKEFTQQDGNEIFGAATISWHL